MTNDRDGAPTDIIARLNLAPHLEGGWYRETWRALAAEGDGGWAPVSCIVLRGFEFCGFEPADPG
jgi:predicted cupin superfamily sugar epimerase